MTKRIPFSDIIKKHGVTASSVALGLGINKSTVSRWDDVPPERVVAVERITGISRHELRPDLSSIFVERSPSEKEDAA